MKGYFHRVAAETPTRLWINNPTVAETRLAIEAGAISCTTNPSYTAKLLTTDERPEVLRSRRPRGGEARDDHEAVDLVQQALARRIMEEFRAVHAAAPARQGFVSVQGNPFRDTDADGIVNEALRYTKLAPNFIAKIPTTEAGLAAMEALLRRNVPVIATEIMAIAQAIDACELYARVARETGNSPAFFVTHITGIFDEYLKETADRQRIAVSAEALRVAGAVVARKQYRLMKDRGYPGILMGGGARGLDSLHGVRRGRDRHHDQLEGHGGQADRGRRAGRPPHRCAGAAGAGRRAAARSCPTSAALTAEDGLPRREYAGYGPVVKFRDSFAKGWNQVLDLVRGQRAGKAIADA